jgi:hypothetical protein
LDEHVISELKATGTSIQFEKEYTSKDGSRVPVIVRVATFDQESDEGIALFSTLQREKKQKKP